jgi:hypothetical protein
MAPSLAISMRESSPHPAPAKPGGTIVKGSWGRAGAPLSERWFEPLRDKSELTQGGRRVAVDQFGVLAYPRKR